MPLHGLTKTQQPGLKKQTTTQIFLMFTLDAFTVTIVCKDASRYNLNPNY
ncbi:Uncharacterised protein [Citrobacter koseri]|uniref:Uncharacterized protein n=1 Tax=Citrobacter koseri TaxID=545 RepID=A0A2X2VJM1_CITKO|nr:Uncharacterised protein [Citrobacter koseri]